MDQGQAMTAGAPVHAVEMKGVSKSFGGVKALIDVDLQVEKGEIHALLGGNGAGKSTILKVLNGVHVPDAGTVLEHCPEPNRGRCGAYLNFG